MRLCNGSVVCEECGCNEFVLTKDGYVCMICKNNIGKWYKKFGTRDDEP